MFSAKITELLEKYQNLPTEQQALMKVLSAFYTFCTPTHLTKFIADLGFEGDRGKTLKLATIKAWLEPLLKAKLVEADKKGAVRCITALAEPITRLTVETGEFENIAAAIERHVPLGPGYYRYRTADDCIRDARFQFHRGLYQEAEKCLKASYLYNGSIPAATDFFLALTLNPFDGDWLLRWHPQIVSLILEYIIQHQLIYLYQDDGISEFLRKQAEHDDFWSDNAMPARLVAEQHLLRGEWDSVKNYTDKSFDPEFQALAACLTFLDGDYSAAVAQFEAALKAERKLTGKRSAYFHGLAGLFYPLAILKNNDPGQRSKLAALLSQAINMNSVWQIIYQHLHTFNQYQQGDIGLRDSLMKNRIVGRFTEGFAADGTPHSLSHPPLLAVVFLTLIKFWTNADQIKQIAPTTRQLYQRLKDDGYQWLAAELAKIFSHVDPKNQTQWDFSFFDNRPFALADLFASRPDWDLALEALSNIQGGGKKAPAARQAENAASRLVWLVTFHESAQAISLEAREQKRQAKGGWSKGRTIALKRLHSEPGQFDFMSEQDRNLCAQIKQHHSSGWYGGGAYFDFGLKMPLQLIGHPLLFWADNPEVRLEAVKGEVELRVRKKGDSGKINIGLEPAPESEQKIHISKETPTRLRIVEFTPEHHKILSVLGRTGLEVPVSAKDRVLQAITGISGLLTVHSDIGGSYGSAEQVDADATPRMHLLPLGEGLRAALLVRPFSSDGAYYRPGQGGENVLAEIGGKHLQATRNFEQETQRAEAVLQACPVLAEAERDESGEWLLEQAEDSLELLLQLQALPEQSVIVEWPEGVKFRVLGQTDSGSFNLKIKRNNDWFGLQGELAVNEDTVIEIQQLLALLDHRQGRFLQLQDGQFIALTEAFRRRLEDLRAYADVTGKKVRINPLAALTLEDWSDEVGGFSADKHWREHLQRLKAARDYQPALPSTFQAELRDYQMDGYIWLARLAQWGVGACLADDMGLGKTVQALALLVGRAPEGPSLIVAPTSVCMNWENEAVRFAPTLNPVILGSGDRQSLLDNLAPYDLLICSYGLLQQEQVAEMLAKVQFQTVILDEAQAIKNVATRRSQGAMNLQAGFKLILTGTPLENHLGELWNLFRFINPGLLGSMEHFNQRYAGPIERDRNAQTRQQLKKLIQPFILRRTKTQVLQELPPRTEIPVYVELSGEEMAFYEAMRRESLAALSDTEGPAGAKHLQILAAITKLRRSCCNTRLVNADIGLPSSKLAAFGEILDELLDNKHKALVFSQFVDHLRLIREYLDNRGVNYQYLDGGTPAKERQQRVDAFQRGAGDLFLISLKAGGVGLNLTAADYVIHMDPWWNPAVEDQASDRAHRMGQQRPVTIYRMIAKQTIEEKIVALHSHKRDLADSLLEGSDISGKMSADDLLGLMRGEA